MKTTSQKSLDAVGLEAKALDFENKIQELEKKAKLDPQGYKRHVVLLVALGYGYIFAALVLIMVIGSIIIFMLVQHPNIFFFKFAIIPAVAAFWIVRSLWVKFDEPSGVPISRSEAPALFDTITDVQTAASSPKLDKVLLSSELNCSVIQIPRLGPLGFHKNILTIGLPLLHALPEKHFKAILAHEMGHLSDRHGKFGAWIYHLQISWSQLAENLNKHGDITTALFCKFANWFYPVFDAHTLVLRREQEHTADEISKSLVGGKICAEALTHTVIKGSNVATNMWENHEVKLLEHPEPARGMISLLLRFIEQPVSHSVAESMLIMEENQEDPTDSHPSLSKRVEALGLSASRQDLLALFESSSQEFSSLQSAAKTLLGDSLERLETSVDEHWCEQIRADWIDKHNQKRQETEELSLLNEKAKSQELSQEELTKRAQLLSLSDKVAAEKTLRDLLNQYPNDPDLHNALGALLLKQGHHEGVEHVEMAIQLKPLLGFQSCISLYRFYVRHGTREQTQQSARRAKTFLSQLIDAGAASGQFSLDDNYEPHGLPPDKIKKICEILYADARVKQAWLVYRPMPALVGGVQSIFVVKLGSPSWFIVDDSQLLQAIPVVGEALEKEAGLENVCLMTWEQIKKNLGTACKTLPNAFIYDRKHWERQNNSHRLDNAVEIALPPTDSKTKKSHLKYWLVFASLFIVSISILAGALFPMETGISKHSDGDIQAIFENERPVFDRLKDMFLQDASLYSLGENLINEQAVDSASLSSALKNAQISEARYKSYLDLLKKVNCITIANTRYVDDNGQIAHDKNEIGFLLWSGAYGKKDKSLVFAKSGMIKRALVVPDTDQAVAASSATLVAGKKIDPNWFIVYGDWTHN